MTAHEGLGIGFAGTGGFFEPFRRFAVVFSDAVALEVEYADHGLRFGIA